MVTSELLDIVVRMGMKMLNLRNMHALSERLKIEAAVVEFRIAPEGA